jgi:D-arabinonate dehydratase/D-galactarolactone cycloisomerase
MTEEIKITEVEAIALEVPITRMDNPPESLPYYQELKSIVFGSYKSVVVKVFGDNSVFGIGECMTRLSPSAVVSIINDVLKPILIGKDVFDTDVIWEEMYGTMRQRGHSKGYFIEAISGVDIAIWDLIGKTLHKPLHKLLGGRFMESAECYASSVRFKRPEEVVTEVRSILKEGYTKVKLKIGRGVEEDVEAVKLLRDEFGYSITIMVDANSGYGVNSALRIGRKLEKLEVYWFEEPIPPDNLPGYRELTTKLDIPIAAGESEFTRFGFRDLFEIGHIDIVQPNVGRAGGISEVKKIISMASACGIEYAPHTGSSSGLTVAAELQLAASASNFLIYEHMRSAWSNEQPNPLSREIMNESIGQPVNSRIRIPTGDGIGVTLNEEAVERYRIK